MKKSIFIAIVLTILRLNAKDEGVVSYICLESLDSITLKGEDKIYIENNNFKEKSYFEKEIQNEKIVKVEFQDGIILDIEEGASGGGPAKINYILIFCSTK